jgi:hypothetical protein
VALVRHLGEDRVLVVGLGVLGRVAALQGDDHRAATAYAECLALSHAVARADLALLLEGLAEVVARQAARQPAGGRMERAARLFGAAAALRAALGDAAARGWTFQLAPPNREAYERQVAAARAALGEEAFATAWAEGEALAPEQAVAAALATRPLATATPEDSVGGGRALPDRRGMAR